MTRAVGETRPLAATTTSAGWPVLVLGVVAAVSWVVTVERMRGMDMGPGTDLGALGWFAVVWVTMMAAMMLPSLSPMAVAYSRAAGRGRARSLLGTVAFAAGYLLPWAAFGVVAWTVVEAARSLDLGFLAWSHAGRYVAGVVILAAALYELTAAKGRCLRRCRDTRLLGERPGVTGALIAGLEQGGFCVGSSAALMAALLALGVMSVAWMLLIAALVAIEKLLPRRVVATGVTAAVLTLLGVAVLIVPDRVPWLTVPMSM